MDYNYGYEYYGELDPATFKVTLIIFIVAAIWCLICQAKINSKAGKPWWAAIIPIYNNIVLLEIAGLPTWNIILLFIPFANIYIAFKIYIEIAKKFGKSAGFGAGLALLFPIIGAILAFDDSKYEASSTITNNENIQQENYCPNCGARSAASNAYCPYCGNKK